MDNLSTKKVNLQELAAVTEVLNIQADKILKKELQECDTKELFLLLTPKELFDFENSTKNEGPKVITIGGIIAQFKDQDKFLKKIRETIFIRQQEAIRLAYYADFVKKVEAMELGDMEELAKEIQESINQEEEVQEDEKS